MPLEILNRAFVFLRRSLGVERVEIFSFARSGILLAGIQLAGFQFPNHNDSLSELVTARGERFENALVSAAAETACVMTVGIEA